MKHGGTVLDSFNDLTVIECTECKFRHLSPLPTEEAMAAYYKTEYTGKRPNYIKVLEEDLPWWRLQYRKRYEVLEGMTDGRVLLDVGCGLGRFMEVGEKRGWNTGGVEASTESCEYAKGLGLYPVWNQHLGCQLAVWEKFPYVSSFATPDVIHAHEVWEHLVEPRVMLELCHSILEPKGVLCLTVPNDYNPLQLALRKLGYPPYWLNKEHINYFRRASLCCLLRETGFKVLRVEMSFPMELFLLMGRDYTKNKYTPNHFLESEGRMCHKMRCELEFNMEKAGLKIPRLLRKTMDALNVGREVTVYARKN